MINARFNGVEFCITSLLFFHRLFSHFVNFIVIRRLIFVDSRKAGAVSEPPHTHAHQKFTHEFNFFFIAFTQAEIFFFFFPFNSFLFRWFAILRIVNRLNYAHNLIYTLNYIEDCTNIK